MKQLLKVIAILVFVLTTPIFFLLLSIKLSGFSAQYLKTGLSKADIYSKVISDMNKNVEVPFGGITPSYIKSKTEKLIDDTEAWVKDKTKSPPSISFSDLNPQAFAQIKKMAIEFKAEQEKMQAAAKAQGETIAAQDLNTFDIDKFIENDFSLPLGEQLLIVKNLYKKVVYGLPVAASLLVLAFCCILLLGKDLGEKFRWLGTAFLIAGVWNILPFALVFFGFKALGAVLENPSQETPAFIKPLIETLVSPIVNKYTTVGMIGIIVLFISAIAFFLISRSQKSETPNKKK